MKNYNIQNYIRYKKDVSFNIRRIEGKMWDEYTRDEMIMMFLPLVENLARKFSTMQQASGVMTINDLIQDGNLGLIKAVDRLDKTRLLESNDIEKTLKSFFAKRIKGAIRRAVDINRGSMRIPEHKLNEIRKNFGKDKKAVAMYFNSIFLSIDANFNGDDDSPTYDLPDDKEPYNIDMMNGYLMGLLRKHLNPKELDVLRLSYGLDCKKHSAEEIAKAIGINSNSSYVRVSQLKRQAVDKLIENVDHSQVLDFL
jgi:RNA polymerase sigma factor (sigma-70 family)